MRLFFILLVSIFVSFPIFSLSTTNYKIHNLGTGETLYKVSKKYNISVKELCEFNKINDVTKIKKGAKIKIPVSNNINVAKKSKSETKISPSQKDDKSAVTTSNNKAALKSNVQTKSKTYLSYNLPMSGNIVPLTNSHFRGIIIFAEGNSQINAIDDGVVSYVDNVYGYGLTVIVKHKNNLICTYSCLDEVNVKKGSIVVKSQLIGTAGNLPRYEKKNGIVFSIQENNQCLKFDMEKLKFYKG
jgi:lipoprotein NlpD